MFLGSRRGSARELEAVKPFGHLIGGVGDVGGLGDAAGHRGCRHRAQGCAIDGAALIACAIRSQVCDDGCLIAGNVCDKCLLDDLPHMDVGAGGADGDVVGRLVQRVG